MTELQSTQTCLPAACEHCGVGLPSLAQFCPHCGHAVNRPSSAPRSRGPRTDLPFGRHLSTDSSSAIEWVQEELPERYKTLRLLGKGGMGVVYLCLDRSLNRNVAIKLMSNRYYADRGAERRFLREARAQAVLNHPNVAQIQNVGISPSGRPFLVMEYLDGSDLRKILRQHPHGMPLKEVLTLTIQTCKGLAEAHHAGIVHRDLKPSNLYVIRDQRGNPHIKILDLGLAKIVGGATEVTTVTADSAGILAGTPAYMSPEQITGATIDARADLYALGVVLFELLTGRLPYESESVEGWLYQHLHATPPLPSRLRPELQTWPRLDRIVMWALSKSPDDRPKSVEEFMAPLQHLRKSMESAESNSEQPAVADPAQEISTETPRSGKKDPFGASFEVPRKGPQDKLQATQLHETLPSSHLLRLEESAVQLLFDRPAPPRPTPHPSIDPRHERFKALFKEAISAEQQKRWEHALELYTQAQGLTDEPEVVRARIEPLRKEIALGKTLASAQSAAAAGDWSRAEAALLESENLAKCDGRVAEARARLPRRLIAAWLMRARSRIDKFPRNYARQRLIRRLAAAQARSGDLARAMELLSEEAAFAPEDVVVGKAQALLACIRSGLRDGVRVFLEHTAVEARQLTDRAAQGRSLLEIARAHLAYGDSIVSNELLKESLEAFKVADGEGLLREDPNDEPDPRNPLWLRSTRTSMLVRRTIRVNPLHEKDHLRFNAYTAVAIAQAAGGFEQDALQTSQLIEDAWLRAGTLARVFEKLCQIGCTPEAETIHQHIAYALPRAKALRALAISRVYASRMDEAEALLPQIGSAEEQAPVLGFLAAAWFTRQNSALAEDYLERAFQVAHEVSGTAPTIGTLLNAAEPLLHVGAEKLTQKLLAAANTLIDGTEEPTDRLHHLLRMARLRFKTLRPGVFFESKVTESGVVAPELYELLRRALTSLQTIQAFEDREECIEHLGYAIGEASASSLSAELFRQVRNESERALAYLGLASGMI